VYVLTSNVLFTLKRTDNTLEDRQYIGGQTIH
jgi:hypothetical protein